jgi:3-dehydroquinate synthase
VVTIPVELAGAGYDVLVGAGLLHDLPAILRERCPAAAYAVISDDVVGPSFGTALLATLRTEGLRAELLTFPHGEASKTRETWAALSDRMLGQQFGRDAAIVALGGGVVGDVAGFVAATYLRGIPYVQVPTTLLAMIDSSIGGKTGVDVPGGKNLLGAFHQPRAVVADVDTLRRLPAALLAGGIAEALKHGVIADAAYFDVVARWSWRDGAATSGAELEQLIAGSVTIKARVVSADEREAGMRAILNFGHTIGHAIEAATAFAVPHGDAVAMGMVAEAHLAEQLGIARRGTAARIQSAVESHGLPVRPATRLPADTVLAAMRRDKKVRGDALRFALPSQIGAMARAADGAWTIPVTETAVRNAL